MRKLSLVFLVVFTLFLNQIVFAQTSKELKTLKEDVKSLKEGQTAIQKDLQEIKTLLRAKQPQPRPRPEFKETVVNIGNSPFEGDKNAKIVLIEFSDYQ
jgi:protein-disulfide isomerase